MKWLLFVFLLIPFANFAQHERPIFKLAPLALVDEFGFPAITGGLEWSFSPKISWYNEVGIRYRTGSYEKVDTSFVSPNGFKVKTELRYYFDEWFGRAPQRFHEYYVGVNFFYNQDRHNQAINYYQQNDSTTVREDDFGVLKKVWGANLIAGWQTHLSKRIMFEVYGGFGIRFRNITTVHEEYDYNRDSLIGPHDVTIGGVKGNIESIGGRSTGGTFTFGVRIGYQF
jgi:hypothetical protein